MPCIPLDVYSPMVVCQLVRTKNAKAPLYIETISHFHSHPYFASQKESKNRACLTVKVTDICHNKARLYQQYLPSQQRHVRRKTSVSCMSRSIAQSKALLVCMNLSNHFVKGVEVTAKTSNRIFRKAFSESYVDEHDRVILDLQSSSSRTK